jgi:enamine deaminase RidA (YjgF/YER057c/UK114 family)
MPTPEENLQKLAQSGFELPEPAPEESNNTRCVRVGNMLYLSAHAPRKGKGTESVYPGVVGREVTLAQAQEAAQYAALSLVATLKRVLGDLSKVKKIVSTSAAVAATPEFSMHTAVLNSGADVLIEVFGRDVGVSARMPFGSPSLGHNHCLVMSGIVEVKE